MLCVRHAAFLRYGKLRKNITEKTKGKIHPWYYRKLRGKKSAWERTHAVQSPVVRGSSAGLHEDDKLVLLTSYVLLKVVRALGSYAFNKQIHIPTDGKTGGSYLYGCWRSATKMKFVTDPDGENEKGLLNCPAADGVEVTAVSILDAPGPEALSPDDN